MQNNEPFPEGTIKSLGIDVKRKFIVVACDSIGDTTYFQNGEILILERDDGSKCPSFTNGRKTEYCNITELAYYDEEINFTPVVGERYEFSDDGTDWERGFFHGYSKGTQFFNLIRPIQQPELVEVNGKKDKKEDIEKLQSY